MKIKWKYLLVLLASTVVEVLPHLLGIEDEKSSPILSGQKSRLSTNSDLSLTEESELVNKALQDLLDRRLSSSKP
jgi:hypothetical protein